MPRPKILIDWQVVEDLLEAGCMGTEIAGYFAMHPNTFYERVVEKYKISFSEFSQQKKAKGEANLRHAQYLKALGKSKKGDNSLLIWLGKQRLNQKENAVDDHVAQEIAKPFAELMNQLSASQAARKIEESSINKDAKSA